MIFNCINQKCHSFTTLLLQQTNRPLWPKDLGFFLSCIDALFTLNVSQSISCGAVKAKIQVWCFVTSHQS